MRWGTASGFWDLGSPKLSRKDRSEDRGKWGSELLGTAKGLMLQGQTGNRLGKAGRH